MKIFTVSFAIVFLLFGRFCQPNPSPTPSPGPTPVPTKVLVIDKVLVNQTPQSGTWLMCFMATAESGASNTFNIPNQTFSGDGIPIDMNLELPNVKDGEKINFRQNLDDDQADVCANSAEDKSNGEFRVSSSGSQTFNFDHWSYVVFWHTK